MKLKVGKFIYIKGVKYRIKFKEKVFLDGEEVDATCDKDEKVIELSHSIKGSHKDKCFLHEVGHAYLAETYLDNFIEDKLEEAICDMFADYVFDFIELDWY